jgi:hypothetical protein
LTRKEGKNPFLHSVYVLLTGLQSGGELDEQIRLWLDTLVAIARAGSDKEERETQKRQVPVGLGNVFKSFKERQKARNLDLQISVCNFEMP